MLNPSIPHRAESVSFCFMLHFPPKPTEQLQKGNNRLICPFPGFPDYYLLLHAFASKR